MSLSKTLSDLIIFRNDLFLKIDSNKVSFDQTGSMTYSYIRQQHIKFIKNAHDIESILINYYYWTAQIERQILREYFLIKYNLANKEYLDEKLMINRKRRNQMVRRLILEVIGTKGLESVKDIGSDVLELKIQGVDLPLHCDHHALLKIKGLIIEKGPSFNLIYKDLMIFNQDREM